MIDRLFTATLTFCMLTGGTIAIGAEMFGIDLRAGAPVQVVQLERVVVIGKRLTPATAVAQSASETAPRVE